MNETEEGEYTPIMAVIFVGTDAFLELVSKSPTTQWLVCRLHSILMDFGVPEKSLPDADEVCLSVFATVTTLLVYFFLFGERHVRKRRRLAKDLRLAQLKVHYLEEKLILAAAEDIYASSCKNNKGEIRLFMDGAFDMMRK